MKRQSDLDRIRLMVEGDSPRTWIFSGDSITQGAMHTHGHRSFMELCSERIRCELRRITDVVINCGVDGATSDVLLKHFDWFVGRFRPDVVVLMIGSNDCKHDVVPRGQFKENLEEYVTRVRHLEAVPVLQTPPYVFFNKEQTPAVSARKSIFRYVEAVRLVAGETATLLVDHWDYWEKAAIGTPETEVANWLDDPIHPGPEGHAEIARLLLGRLSI